MIEKLDDLRGLFTRLGVDFDTFLRRVESYKVLLKNFNKTHNLTNFKDFDTQIIDSVKVLEFRDLGWVKQAVDIGSGAGFPAVFLAMILRANFTLFEPNAKKAAFLRMVKIECGLDNLSIEKEKAQNYTKALKADLISSRALMSVLNLVQLCRNFMYEKSEFLLYKGSNLNAELAELSHEAKFESQIYELGFRRYCFLKAL